jgi:asparagine synthetase B (glutamine-hydrolysing)
LAGVAPSEALPVGHAVRSTNAASWEFEGDEPDGSWIGLKFDRHRDLVSIASDLFLLQRWYYTCFEGSWYFANSLLFLQRVLQGQLEIELRAVPYMLLSGYLPFDITPLKDVYDLRSGRVLVIERGKSHLAVRAKIPIQRRTQTSGEDIPKSIASVLREAVARELQYLDSVIVPLSGGIDSRFLLGYALEILPREQTTTFTYGYPRSLDFTIGTGLAKKLGVKNIALPMDERRIGQILDENFADAEGMYWAYPDYPVGPFRSALPKNSYVLSGHNGGAVFGSYDLQESRLLPRSLGEEEHLLHLVRQTAFISSPTAVSSLVQLGAWDPLGFESAVRAIRGPHLGERYRYWEFDFRYTNRANFAVEVHRDRAFYLAPFVHRRVLDVAYALPSAARQGEKAFFAALKQRFPELYSYPAKKNYGFPLGIPMNPRISATRVWRKVWSQVDEVLGAHTGRMLYHHPRNNYAHPRELYRKKHFADVVRCFDELPNLDVFDRKPLAMLRDRYRRRKKIDPALLRGLLTVHQWWRHYRKPYN